MDDLPVLFIVKEDDEGREKLYRFARKPFEEEHLEEQLEEWVKNDVSVLGPYEVFGQQVHFGGGERRRPDLLAVDEDKNLTVIEFKRGEAAEDVVFQILNYAAWAAEQRYEVLNERAVRYFEDNKLPYRSLKELYDVRFGVVEQADSEEAGAAGSVDGVEGEESIEKFVRDFNRRQRIVLVASHITDEVKRVLRYVASQTLLVEWHEFGYYESEKGEKLISRTFTTTVERSDEGGAQRARWGEKHWNTDRIRDWVQTDFLKSVAGSFEGWVQSPEEFDQTVVKLRPRIDTESAISIGDKNQLIYYYNRRWMYFYLKNYTAEEIALLEEAISNKASIRRWEEEETAAFRVEVPDDLEVVKRMITQRYQGAIA